MSDEAGDGGGSGGPRSVEVDVDPRSLLRLGLIAMLASAIWAIVTMAPDMVTRLAIGLVVGLALSPIASAVERRWNVRRGVASLVVGGGLVVFFAVVVLLVAPPAVRQASRFSRELPATVEELYSWPVVGQRLEDADAATEVSEAIEELPARIDDERLGDLGERVLGGAFSTVVVLVTALGVLVDGPLLVRRMRAVVPPARRASADDVGRIVYASFGSYFAGSLLVAVLNGLVILTSGLILGVPLAPIAGIWSTLTNFIPQIGGFLGGSFFVVLALTKSPVTAVIAALIFLGYQQFENNVIGPAVVGSAVNLTPPATMLAALVGGAAAGVPGALVATPLIGAAKALYLDRRGMLPPTKEAALTRRIRQRLEKARARVEAVADAVLPGD
ncbi:MAG: AI-2E family transporter [Actinomycetota bacterium]|nr:AI-2E family transporter [Actinomycetota bacterium]